MTPDNLLRGAALVELVQRLDGTNELDDHISLIGGDAVCDHHRIALYLAGLCAHIAADTGFDLAAFIAAERREALAVEDPPGMAWPAAPGSYADCGCKYCAKSRHVGCDCPASAPTSRRSSIM